MYLSSLEHLLGRGWSLTVLLQADGRYLARAVRTTATADVHLSETGESLQGAVGKLLERIEE